MEQRVIHLPAVPRKPRWRPFTAIFLLAATAVVLTGCSRRVSEKPTARPLNIIFILVDTLRADHLRIYGYARRTSPSVDDFAHRSILFRAARSQASCTFPSVNSILTSRHAGYFVGQPVGSLGIPPSIPTIAEVLRQHGYRTVAVSASPVVRNRPSPENPTGGFGRGFDVFHEDCRWEPARCVNVSALEELARSRDRKRPLFLYLHYLDPHDPYAPPPLHQLRFARESSPDKDFIHRGDPNPVASMLYSGAPDPGMTPADLQHLIDLYDDEIAYFDARFARLVHALKVGGWLRDSIVVFTADHGEEFMDHGQMKHCHTVFDSEVRVPLFLHIPGVQARKIAAPVQSLDIVPTLLDYLGVPTGAMTPDGRSLRPLIETGQGGDSLQFSIGGVARSVSDGRFKLVRELGRPGAQLFDLQRDPGETNDVLAAERPVSHRLRSQMESWLLRTEGYEDEALRKSKEAEAKLKALGYLQ